MRNFGGGRGEGECPPAFFVPKSICIYIYIYTYSEKESAFFVPKSVYIYSQKSYVYIRIFLFGYVYSLRYIKYSGGAFPPRDPSYACQELYEVFTLDKE